MKKLMTLLAAILFTTGMVFAQNNDADVNQEVDDSEVTIMQLGSDNKAETDQIDGNGNMSININQSGANNDSDILQVKGQWHEAQIDQLGSGNEIDLTQDNTSTLATINQNGTDNKADVYQRNYLFSFGTYSSSVGVDQTGDNNQAWVDSDGFGNNVSITQGSSGTPSNGQYANVTQDGSDNESSIEQFGNGGADHTQIQDGSANNAVAESSWGSSTGLQEQYGSENTSIFKQNGYHNATTIQDGLNNYSWLRQSAGSSTAMFDQVGDNNQVNADQRGVGNTMDVDQTGNGNTAGTVGFTNRGLFQIGDNNMMNVVQNGDMNSAYVNQNGNMNQTTINQSSGSGS